MPRNNRPRKKYRPRPVVKPFNQRDAWAIEGDAHAVLLAIEYDQVAEEHLAMLAAHADIMRRIHPTGTAPRVQADTLIRIVRDIQSRPEI
ncbi:hypothetical protein, partial [Immundisolibacter sp.]|uniref:hypothetical protein n=1 Tax=Immundisolibacter sp. TaxID=1934948 RepID=UPI002635E1E7